MAAQKRVSKRKCGIPGVSGATKKTVTEKKKHVRELAKARRWAEIERLYGKKIVTKAKTYAENHVVKNAQEIAREILVKNGLLSSTAQTTAEITRGNVQQLDAAIRSASPETLTKEQQELIEKRRREALERRRRARFSGMAPRPPVVIQPDSAEATRRSVQHSVVPLNRQRAPPSQPTRTVSTVQPRAKTHRVVTPENLPTTNMTVDTNQTRPEYFWDDLEAAAEIVQWENEHMAHAALVQSPITTSRRAVTNQQQTHQSKPKTQPLAVSTISQELAAAAEIIQWENEREDSSEVPAFGKPDDSLESDPGLDIPQFQLLPVHITDDFEQHELSAQERERSRINNAKSESKTNSQRKRPLEASPPPAPPHSSVDSSKALHPGERNQRDPTAEFIDKHILEDKLEIPVLEFLDMMLA